MKSILKDYKLLLGDITEHSNNISDDSIDFIFTDPPYGFQHIHLYERLAEAASRLLKEGSSLVTYVPQLYLLDIMRIFGREGLGLKYWWMFCVKHRGNHNINYQKKIFSTWKPLLWYIKGDKIGYSERMNDLIDSQKPIKALHDWEQSLVEAAHVIRGLTVENEIVLDCFMGSGTTGIAALKLNRKFIGIEIDPLHYSNAQRRLSYMAKEISK